MRIRRNDTAGMIGALIGGLAMIAIVIAFAAGWGMNLYTLCTVTKWTDTKAVVIRSVGIVVAPAGAVIGYLDIENKEVK